LDPPDLESETRASHKARGICPCFRARLHSLGKKNRPWLARVSILRPGIRAQTGVPNTGAPGTPAVGVMGWQRARRWRDEVGAHRLLQTSREPYQGTTFSRAEKQRTMNRLQPLHQRSCAAGRRQKPRPSGRRISAPKMSWPQARRIPDARVSLKKS
jgi:hypothetical protein